MKNFTVHFIETGTNIILIEMSGNLDSPEGFKRFEDFAEELDSRIEAKFQNIQGKANFLISVEGLSISSTYSLDVFRVLEKSTKRTKKYDGKTAVYGATYTIEMLADAIIALSFHNEIKFFRTKKEAIAWLEE